MNCVLKYGKWGDFYLKNNTDNKLVYDTDRVDYYLKHKILDAFLELLYEHNSGIHSLADKPMNLDLFIISLIPDDVVEEYERIRLNYESELKQLIKRIEGLPVNLL
ncbi:hypothetical protein Si004_00587 [Streptococcus infantarius subsp. infantarius]|nr:hypothetical protein [Streptococcus infantarius subsp. infantarius]MCO4645189.1 hypothetical protein [Streptococcus infantarius subsp. infantarius]MCO4670234.1 hypothetical protein [Streptococcus infantarius subsp. infantarius]MCO4677163.1 hypothetical protein [Streptococcus infantarius subsp. infantarius]MCO4680566.1 hypothetical protein [Streptococcus infantarius subsp. infantarius]